MAYTRQLRSGTTSALVDTGVAAAGASVGVPPQVSVTVAHVIESIFGGSAGAPSVGKGNKIDQARAARADSYLVGALVAGSVDAVRLALGAKQTNTAAAEQLLYTKVLAAIKQNAPDLYAQAANIGAEHDTASGLQGLQILYASRVPFNDPWAGYSTANGADLGDGAPQLAAQLASLAGGGVGVGQGTTLLAQTPPAVAPPSPTTRPLGATASGLPRTTAAGFGSPLMLLAIAGAIYVAATRTGQRER